MDNKLPVKTVKFTSLENLYIYGSFTMSMSGLPNMHIQGLRAEGVYVYQVNHRYKRYNCHVLYSPPLAS